jgi:hypothetical protein
VSEDDLKSFKISDQVKQKVDRPRGKSAQPEASSVGFPRIEQLLEAEEPDLSGLGQRMDALDELSQSGSAREKAAAKKARAAYDRTVDVLEFLVSTKQAMSPPSE